MDKAKIRREVYISVKTALNKERQCKIEALRCLKGSKILAKHMPQSTYSKSINGIKASIREIDQKLVDLEEKYKYNPSSELISDWFSNVNEVLNRAERYLEQRYQTVETGSLLEEIQAIKSMIKKYFKNN